MQKSQLDFLKALLRTPSPTGFETAGQRVWLDAVKQFAEKTEHDAYGNAWATVKGTTDRVLMLEAHADEIGFMVKHINKEGFLSVDMIGGTDVATARGRRITLYGDQGEITGVIGNTAIHLRDRENEKAPKVHELFVDVGAKDEKEVAKMGIRVGHPAVYNDPVLELGKHRIVSRAIDNRLGGFIIAEVLHTVKASGKKPEWTLHAVNAIQEEIGGYGARMMTHRLKPSCAIIFDVAHATDTPGIKLEQHGKIEMGKGPTVMHGQGNHPAVVERLVAVAGKKKIPFQHESSSRYSKTDTDQIYHMFEGIPSALVSTPVRYMHSATEMADLRDVEQAIKLLTEFVLSLKGKDEFSVKI